MSAFGAGSQAAIPVPYLCATESHFGWVRVGSRLDHVRSPWSGLPSKRTNYINPIADCLGVDLEPEMTQRP